MRPGTAAASRDEIAAALQTYADRGIFRGFDAVPAGRGRTRYQFLWLTRRPITAIADSRARTLTFQDLFPLPPRDVASDVKAMLAARTGRHQPSHKRIDGRRASVSMSTRGGGLSLRVVIRGANQAYAVRVALKLINDLFVMLHEHHPEYLVQHFGVSSE